MAKYRVLAAAKGPRDWWGGEEDKTATLGNSLQFEFRQEAGVSSMATERWFHGISLAFTSRPLPVVLPDYPSVNEDCEVAAAELDRLAPLGQIHWCDEVSYPPDL